MTGGMLTFLRVLAGTRSPAHGIADHEDDPAGDQRGEQQHQAGRARALQHARRTRRILHLRPRATETVNRHLSRAPHTRDIQRHTPSHTCTHVARARAGTHTPETGKDAEKTPVLCAGARGTSHHAIRRPWNDERKRAGMREGVRACVRAYCCPVSASPHVRACVSVRAPGA